MSTILPFRRKAGMSGALKITGLIAVPIAILAGILFYTSTDSAAYPMHDDALQAAVLAKLQPRLRALQVSRMVWSACRLDNPVSIASKFVASAGKYRFGASGDYDTCDSAGLAKTLRWSFVIERSGDGSYRMRIHDIDHDVPFATYRQSAIESGNAAVDQLERQIRSDREVANRRAQAQASWRDAAHS
jgi:hypothetical protein